MSNFKDEVCEYYYSSSVTENFGTEHFGRGGHGNGYGSVKNPLQICSDKCSYSDDEFREICRRNN